MDLLRITSLCCQLMTEISFDRIVAAATLALLFELRVHKSIENGKMSIVSSFDTRFCFNAISCIRPLWMRIFCSNNWSVNGINSSHQSNGLYQNHWQTLHCIQSIRFFSVTIHILSIIYHFLQIIFRLN